MAAITIRRGLPADYPAVARIFTGPQAVSGTLQVPFSSPEIWRSRMETEGAYMLVASVDGDLVGQINVMTFPNSPRRKHVGEIGMAVRDDWQGRGVGTALMQAAVDLSDNWLALTRLELEVFVDNPPAVRLYQKFGFEIEGVKRAFAYRDGRYVDVYAMARLHSPRGN